MPAKLLPLIQVVVGIVLFAVVAVAAAREWHSVKETIAQLSPWALAASCLLALVGLFASSLTWHALVQELGSDVTRHAAARVYLVGQLGKYIPGSVWAFVLQMELGRRAGIPRPRVIAAALAAIGINLVVALAIGLLAIVPVAAGSARTWIAVLVLLPIGLVAATPSMLTREVNLLMRLVRWAPLERPIRWHGVLLAGSWSVVSWVAYGLALWVLVESSGKATDSALGLSLGGVPLAMSAGFLVIVAPSGIGVREAAIVAALSPVMDEAEALALALVLRAVFTLADFVAPALAMAVPLHWVARKGTREGRHALVLEGEGEPTGSPVRASEDRQSG